MNSINKLIRKNLIQDSIDIIIDDHYWHGLRRRISIDEYFYKVVSEKEFMWYYMDRYNYARLYHMQNLIRTTYYDRIRKISTLFMR